MRASDIMSTRQVAKVLGVSRQTLYNWLNAGRIPEPIRHPLTKHMQWKVEDVNRIQRILEEERAS
jgi:predicted site-specific integrase-resolvase